MIVLPGAILMGPNVSFLSLGVLNTSLGTLRSRKMGGGFQKLGEADALREQIFQMKYNQTPAQWGNWGLHMYKNEVDKLDRVVPAFGRQKKKDQRFKTIRNTGSSLVESRELCRTCGLLTVSDCDAREMFSPNEDYLSLHSVPTMRPREDHRAGRHEGGRHSRSFSLTDVWWFYFLPVCISCFF